MNSRRGGAPSSAEPQAFSLHPQMFLWRSGLAAQQWNPGFMGAEAMEGAEA